jgi:soluble lytic murein transglycosylase-like protein
MFKTTLVAFLLAPSLFITQTNIDQEQVVQEPVVVKTERQLILESISTNAAQYKVDKDLIYKVMMCESSGNPKAINKNEPNGKLSVGIMQFQYDSWLYFEKKYNLDLDYYSNTDQIKLATIAIANNDGKHWTCYRKIVGV